ncbi:restriction endonuclease subunit S [Micromonospora sp. NPDC049151]|uniref:restriction endonuclease subunit S n=1 Tax=Micromonospora sp. NPDC049151 TaxID=3155648 RepID=UPI0033E8DA57
MTLAEEALKLSAIDFPKGWKRRRLRDVVRLVNGYPFPSDSFASSGSIPLVRIRDLLASEFQTYASGHVPSQVMMRDGDVVVGMDGDFNVVIWKRGTAALNQRLCLLRPREAVDMRFIAYALPLILKVINDLTFSTTVKHLSSSDLLTERLLLPPLDEQRRIADFLDVQTARVVALDDCRDRQLAAYEARLQGMVKIKTGRNLAWDRESPIDGSVLPLRRVAKRVKTGATPPGAAERYFVGDDQGIPWFAPVSFGNAIKLGMAPRRLSSLAVQEGFPVFEAGSTLLVGIGATAGKVAYLEERASGNQQVTAVAPNERIDGRYLAWQLFAATEELRSLAPYTTMPIINNDFLKSFPIWLPPLDRQRAAVREIEQVHEHLSRLRLAFAEARSLLSEWRQSLTAAAVTGQIDVTTARGVDV